MHCVFHVYNILKEANSKLSILDAQGMCALMENKLYPGQGKKRTVIEWLCVFTGISKWNFIPLKLQTKTYLKNVIYAHSKYELWFPTQSYSFMGAKPQD